MLQGNVSPIASVHMQFSGISTAQTVFKTSDVGTLEADVTPCAGEGLFSDQDSKGSVSLRGRGWAEFLAASSANWNLNTQ